MPSKRRLVLILSLALILGLNVVFFLYARPALQQQNVWDPVRAMLDRTEAARPPYIDHTQVVTPTEIINHPKPDLVVDDKILKAFNCPLEDGARYCPYMLPDSPKGPFKCDSISTPYSFLGGLSPAYPMADCSVSGGKYVYQSGCNIYFGQAYIIERNGKYELIDTPAKLKATFAPIETENEALSYAIAVTGYGAWYGIKMPDNTPPKPDATSQELLEIERSLREFLVEKLEDTHVDKLGDEYLVHLYEYSLCGCGQHETFGVDVAVSRQGNVREIHREAVARDVMMRCID